MFESNLLKINALFYISAQKLQVINDGNGGNDGNDDNFNFSSRLHAS